MCVTRVVNKASSRKKGREKIAVKIALRFTAGDSLIRMTIRAQTRMSVRKMEQVGSSQPPLNFDKKEKIKKIILTTKS